MTEKEINSIDKFEKFIIENNVSDDFLVQIFELTKQYLGLKTITNYAKSECITYNGVLKRKPKMVNIENIKFVINNV